MNVAPGFNTLATIRPMINAKVEITSKYNSALPPTRPTFFMLPAPAMPRTTVQKMIGEISILTSAMKPSPSGLSFTPVSGLA